MPPLAVSTGVAIAYAVALVAVVFGPTVIAELKGQDFLIGFSVLTLGVSCWFAMFRLAHPDSWWARHFYGPHKLARARERYAWEEGW